MVSNALTLLDNFNKLTPYAVGFDRVFDNLNRYVDNNVTSTGFPPYNIRKEGDYNYVIEMALAGFGKDDIEVEVICSSGQADTVHGDGDQVVGEPVVGYQDAGVDVGVSSRDTPEIHVHFFPHSCANMRHLRSNPRFCSGL